MAQLPYVTSLKAEIRREETDDDFEDVGILRGLDVLDVGCGGGLLSEVRVVTTVETCELEDLFCGMQEPRPYGRGYSRD